MLLEGPIATLFDSSRTPVKQALASLEQEGRVRRFEGRGYLAGTTDGPHRVPVSAEMLGMDAEAVNPKAPAWQTYYYDFENAVILRATMGEGRINELALARHYGVSRTVAGDLLNHAARHGLVVRDEKSRWLINPLDETRFQNLYDLRLLLEPAALRTAITAVPDEVVQQMHHRLASVSTPFPDTDSSELDQLEEDIHVDLLNYSSNPEVLEALKRTRSVFIAGKHIQRAVRTLWPIDTFKTQHIQIIEAVAMKDYRLARRCLHDHLLESKKLAKERLRAFQEQGHAAPLPYLFDLA